MVTSYQKGILAIGAHPDDIELGCGASLSRLIKEGYHVTAVVMTAGAEGCVLKADRHAESQSALTSLGCHQIFHFHFEDTRTPYFVDTMIKSLEDVITNHIPAQINIVRTYTMHDSDRHQDHRAVHKASIVACRNIPQVLGYETPSTWLTFVPQVFEKVSENCFIQKLRALSFHQSQQQRDYMRTERLRTVAQFRGQQAGCELSEGFVVHKMIL
ncbi:TPA: PIG-L family deacetylase [Citrobacter braakii]|jgi:LmbE family N-acetylglucosaminyl deacetylase|uniref:PIG-L deacetylase family protein n=1 Tax=Citrobacter TaxID=544 RepID=UPI00064364A0|nr:MULTISPECIES: PIG-L deacetylase family protein [Citrobacter]OCF81486.1 deacetylase [Citrobacter freundii]EGT5655214.1 PIG-L family deacetylase [Citrobacter braakii]EKW2138600.1 PIG-L family deacetylase [Citrobacter braakii]ELN4156064.1 PIG-L family deacetylase [Citrobacter braakii]KLQ27461.1 deacetylase [Citrobacter braakii]